MQDAFSYCAELVRTADKDRFLSSLFAPAEHRSALHALHAFNIEVARVRDIAREPLPGEIRLQWWTEVLRGERAGEAAANPVADALIQTVARYKLTVEPLATLVEAHSFDLYDENLATIAELEAYAAKTSSAVIALAAQILAGVVLDAVAAPAGIALAIAALLRAFPLHAARGQLYVPLDLLRSHQVQPEDIFAGRSSGNLKSALAEFASLGLGHLDTMHERMASLPREALPAFLPVVLVRPSLDRLRRSDPFAPAEMSPWRRQWLIWRAARNPARITR